MRQTNPVRQILLSVFILLLGISCEDDEPGEFYQYYGFDSLGVKIVQGSLIILRGDSTDVTGEWALSKTGNPQNIGPQVGTGTFVGWLDSTVLFVNLNPDYADNNVNLWGILTGDQIKGEWYYSGIQGIVNRGTFRAEK